MSEHLVTDARAAALLADRARSRYLGPFLGRECSLAAAAGTLGVSKSRMSYWVKVLSALGLLRVVRTEKQLRHTRRLYRAVADTLVVPLELIPAPSDEALLEQHFAGSWHAFLRALARAGRHRAAQWQLRYARREGVPTSEIRPRGGALGDLGLVNTWARLELSPARAAALQGALTELVATYLADTDAEEGKTYLVHVGMVEVL